MKLQRGQKQCKHCKAINAARQRVCTSCDREFKIKKSRMRNEITDWRAMEVGECFRVINGSGPYFTITANCAEGNRGDKIMMGERGKFQVVGIEKNGIYARGMTGYNFGTRDVYMGEDFYNKELNIHRTAHRIVKIKKPKSKY